MILIDFKQEEKTQNQEITLKVSLNKDGTMDIEEKRKYK